ncbi:MAG: methionine gamma-lyase family protein, partial [Clostridia bacterium]|nr:methionine gamma-lyase family protein [Clostridia bacterium]
DLIKFCQGLQKGSPIDSFVTPIPCEMPGYPHDEVMGAGTFTAGSTIELTCDAPVVDPYTVFIQGGIAYEYGKLGIMMAITEILKNK